jgi:integrase
MGITKLDACIHEQRPGYFIYHFRNPLTGRWTTAPVGRTPKEANEGKQRIVEELHKTGTFKPGNPSMAELWAEYERVKTPTLAPSTMSDYRSMWRKVERLLGRHRVKDITTDRLRLVLDRLDEPATASGQRARDAVHQLSEKRKHNITMFLKSLFSFAVAEGWLTRSPASGLAGRRYTQPTIHVPKRADLDRLRKKMPADYRPLVTTMLYTGIRLGEAVALRWADWEDQDSPDKASLLHVEQSCSRGQICPPKSGHPRVVPVPDWVRDELRTWKRRCNRTHPGCPWMFPSKKGTRLCPDNFRARVWKPACVKAKLPDLRIHDLRHTYITWLVEKNQSPLIIQSIAGHANIKTTERYIDIRDKALRGVANALD